MTKMLVGKGSYSRVLATESPCRVIKVHDDEARCAAEVRAYLIGNQKRLLMPRMHAHDEISVTLQRFAKTLDRHARSCTAAQRQLWVTQQAGFLVRELTRIHAAGIYHNDIHPGNILVDSQGKPVFADFGAATLAWVPPASERMRSPAGRCPTKRDYAAPEGSPGAAADLWSLGSCLYYVWTGSPYSLGAPLPRSRVVASLLSLDPRLRLNALAAGEGEK